MGRLSNIIMHHGLCSEGAREKFMSLCVCTCSEDPEQRALVGSRKKDADLNSIASMQRITGYGRESVRRTEGGRRAKESTNRLMKSNLREVGKIRILNSTPSISTICCNNTVFFLLMDLPVITGYDSSITYCILWLFFPDSS